MKKILSIIFFLLLIFSSYSFSDDKSIIKKLDGLNFPVQIIKNEQISNNSIFVLEHRPGAIIEIENFFDQNSEKKINKILDLSSIITDVDSWEQGVQSFAFSPNFSNDNLVFVSYNNKNNQLVLSSFQYEHSSRTIPISTEEVILKIDRIFDKSLTKNEHTCGTIKFHPIDNFLYLCTGDARSPELSQDFQSLNGKILRIDPFTLNKDENKKYKSPEKNPYIKIDGRPEIVFAGLRNPWAFSFDLDTGDAFIPDIGSEYIEELNIVSYSEFDSLLNFGWSCYEGTYRIYDKHYEDVVNSSKPCKENLNNKLLKFKEPSLQYFHDSLFNTNGKYGNSIIGGVLYKNENSIWHNHYFFGDLVSSNIWYLDMNNPIQKGINFISGENLDIGLTSITQIDDKILATSFMGSIYEILLPESKDLEKYLYGRPTVNKDLDVIKFMNDNDQIVFTSGSKFYYMLKKFRKYYNLLFD